MYASWGLFKRVGWAAVQVDRTGRLLKAAYGPVPWDVAPMQEARDGEDYAVFMAAQLVDVAQPCELFLDCAGTLGCLLGAAEKAVAPSNARAHL